MASETKRAGGLDHRVEATLAPAPEIAVFMEKLIRECLQTKEMLSELATRLRPVLTVQPEVPKVDVEEAQPRQAASSLGAELQMVRDHLSDMRAIVRDLYDSSWKERGGKP